MIELAPYQLQQETPKKGNGKGMVTPEQLVKMYKQDGEEITLDEAKLILTFMYKLAKLAVHQVLTK